MKEIIAITFILISNLIYAQLTAIPDTVFEQYLIDFGYDTGALNGTIPTANINTVTSLTLHSSTPLVAPPIYDLTGIEDFSSLTYLDCSKNQLSILDLSQNTALTSLNCSFNSLTNLNINQNSSLTNLICNNNQLTSLDVTQNDSLIYLYCYLNQLNSLDLSQNSLLISLRCYFNQLVNLDLTQNIVLTELHCYYNQITNLNLTQNIDLISLACYANQITSFDLSQNLALTFLNCSDNLLTNLDISQNNLLTFLMCHNNQLTCLNVNNGNNTNLNVFMVNNNPNLLCIEVDNDVFSSANWVDTNYYKFDNIASFSNNCMNPCTVGIDEVELPEIGIYPNPTSYQITIDYGGFQIKAISIINTSGKLVKTFFSNIKTINVSDLPNGIYFLKLIGEENVFNIKFIKQ